LSNLDDAPLKIIDLGLSMFFNAKAKPDNDMSLAYYVAPEVIQGIPLYQQCDVWSCGVILYTMLSGSPPFSGSNEAEVHAKILEGSVRVRGSKWSSVSTDAKNLIKKMLVKNAAERIPIHEAFEDHWVQSRAQDLVEDNVINENTFGNLLKFRARSKLQQATLAFISGHLAPTQEIEELKDRFEALDANHDGKLSQDEIRKGIDKHPKLAAMNIGGLLQHLDSDKSGFVDYNEFLRAAIDWHKELSQERLEAAFNAIDKDHSGTISIDEIRAFIGESSGMEDVLREADLNGDGVLDLGEFKAAMLKRVE